MSTVRPHMQNMQNMVAATDGGWGGHMGVVVPSHAFSVFFFGSFNASTAYPKKRGFSLNAPTCVSVVAVFHWGRFAHGSNPLLCTPQKPFFNRPIKAVSLHDS